jgi:6-phosphogluconolactonase
VRWVVSIHAAAAAIPARLTLTLPVLNAAGRVAFLVSGPEKAKVIRAVLREGAMLPAALVRTEDGTVDWLIDRGAAAQLDAPRRT